MGRYRQGSEHIEPAVEGNRTARTAPDLRLELVLAAGDDNVVPRFLKVIEVAENRPARSADRLHHLLDRSTLLQNRDQLLMATGDGLRALHRLHEPRSRLLLLRVGTETTLGKRILQGEQCWLRPRRLVEQRLFTLAKDH